MSQSNQDLDRILSSESELTIINFHNLIHKLHNTNIYKDNSEVHINNFINMFGENSRKLYRIFENFGVDTSKKFINVKDLKTILPKKHEMDEYLLELDLQSAHGKKYKKKISGKKKSRNKIYRNKKSKNKKSKKKKSRNKIYRNKKSRK